MSILIELMNLSEVSKEAEAAVYHANYMKTRKKPYRKYNAKKHRRLSENLTVSDIDKAHAMLPKQDNDKDVRDDLYLLKTIADKLTPDSIFVEKNDDSDTAPHIAHFKYAISDNHKMLHIVHTMKELFGSPDHKNANDTVTVAYFIDDHTGRTIALMLNKQEHIAKITFALKTKKQKDAEPEHGDHQVSISERAGAPADSAAPTANHSPDDSTVDKLLYLRTSVINMLNSHDKMKDYIYNAPTLSDAKERLINVIAEMPDNQSVLPSDIIEVAEQITATYWGKS